MKVLILGAGYGTRLERDLKNDTTGKYQDLIGVPKPLLPIGKDRLVTHWMKDIKNIDIIDKVYIVTNAINHSQFVSWATDWPIVELLCDGSTSNETRIGAVGAMNLAATHFGITDDLLIIAGDTLLYEDFNLEETIRKFKKFQEIQAGASMLVYVTCTDEEVHKYGILETDDTMRVTGFLEKPQPTETTSRKECPCFYFFAPSAFPLLGQFLEEKKDEPLKARDATGNFVKYLYQKQPVYATEISGRFDVGGLKSYIVCHEHFLKSSKSSSS